MPFQRNNDRTFFVSSTPASKDLQRAVELANAEAKAFRSAVSSRRSAKPHATASGAASSSSVGASASSGVSVGAALVPIPAGLDLDTIAAYMPPELKIPVAFESQSGSIRAWYPLIGGGRKSCNASTVLHGAKAVTIVLEKVWLTHKEIRGVECPYSFTS